LGGANGYIKDKHLKECEEEELNELQNNHKTEFKHSYPNVIFFAIIVL
jgi:hypothetical protein